MMIFRSSKLINYVKEARFGVKMVTVAFMSSSSFLGNGNQFVVYKVNNNFMLKYDNYRGHLFCCVSLIWLIGWWKCCFIKWDFIFMNPQGNTRSDNAGKFCCSFSRSKQLISTPDWGWLWIHVHTLWFPRNSAGMTLIPLSFSCKYVHMDLHANLSVHYKVPPTKATMITDTLPHYTAVIFRITKKCTCGVCVVILIKTSNWICVLLTWPSHVDERRWSRRFEPSLHIALSYHALSFHLYRWGIESLNTENKDIALSIERERE